jgi:uncharacterized membrane protein
MNIRRPLIVSAGLILVMAGLSLAAAVVLPASVPLRFDARGIPTVYGSPIMPLVVMPIAGIIISAIFVALAHIEPRRDNLTASRVPYAARWIAAVSVMTVIHLWIVYTLDTTVHGAAPVDPERLVIALAGVVIAIAGSQLTKLHSNFTIGIRTRWTLSDDGVWQRTHRLARIPVMLTGAAIFVAALMASKAILFGTVMAIVIVSGVALALLSYVLWHRSDANGLGV